jgi:hypothetical protein
MIIFNIHNLTLWSNPSSEVPTLCLTSCSLYLWFHRMIIFVYVIKNDGLLSWLGRASVLISLINYYTIRYVVTPCDQIPLVRSPPSVSCLICYIYGLTLWSNPSIVSFPPSVSSLVYSIVSMVSPCDQIPRVQLQWLAQRPSHAQHCTADRNCFA